MAAMNVSAQAEGTVLLTPEMTVREISARYPACREVFIRYGMGGCGGELGPDEPLSFFAQAHQVDLPALLKELEQAACRQGDEPSEVVARLAAFEARLARVYKSYIKAAILVALTVGTTWGVHILAKIAVSESFNAPNYAATQAHGHAQLYGWVGLFIMGVAYFSLPKIMNARLRTLSRAWLVFALMFSGVLLRSISQPLAPSQPFGGLLLVSAICELAAVGLFAVDVALLFVHDRRPKPHFVWFICASVLALVAMAFWNLALVNPLWRGLAVVVAEPANGKFLYLAIFGFVVNMILGYSARLLPTFLGLRPTRQTLLVPALVLFNAGVIARLADWALAAGVLGFVGMGVYVWALRIFESPATYVKSRGVDASFSWFVYLAYAWFVIAVTMVFGGDVYLALTSSAPPHIYIGAWRHAITVGFITTLMMGVGYRILPLFGGVDLWRPGWMRVSFWLVALGCGMRVAFQLGTATGSRSVYWLMGSSGLLELSALSLFSLSIWKTLGRRQQVLVTEGQISVHTHVRWLLDNFPQAREELIRAGLHHLRHNITVPAFVTLEQAARIHGVDPEAIAAHLRATLQAKPS